VNYFGRETCHTSLTLSRRLVRTAVPNIEDFLVQPISSDAPALRLLKGYLNIWQNGELATTAREQQALSDHVYDLMALMFGARGDVAEQAILGGGRAARLAEIRREIEKSALDPKFSLPELALRIGVSPRYVQALLKEQDTSFLDEVGQRRLEQALRLLQSPRHRSLPIADVAWQCGFPSVKYFHRVFRARFGATPGDVRAGVTVPRIRELERARL
jgi:AraC-like DNA-binding protein